MADEPTHDEQEFDEPVEQEHDADADTGTATAEKPADPKLMPPWKVLLHNDDVNDMLFVVNTIIELTPLDREDSIQRMFEAHHTGVALLLMTHQERAELYRDQFTSKGLTVTIEPDDAD